MRGVRRRAPPGADRDSLAARHSPDSILLNGRILTLDANSSLAEALAIRAGRIVAIGRTEAITELAGPSSHRFDVDGRVVLPGFIDSHAHMDREGLRHAYPSLQGCRSISDVQTAVRRAVAERRPGEWVVLLPLGEPPFHNSPELTLVERRYPTRQDLDPVSRDHPVWIRAVWPRWNGRPPFVHVLNTAALRACGITGTTECPSSVEIEADAQGELTGRILEVGFTPLAEHTILQAAPRFDHSTRVAALRRAMELSAAAGTTSVYEGHGVAPEVMDAYRQVHDQGGQLVRAVLPVSPPPWRSLAEAADWVIERAHHDDQGTGDAWLKVAGVALDYGGDAEAARLSQAAWPYTGWAGFGEHALSADEYRALSVVAAQHRVRVNTIIDMSIDEVLTIWEEVDQDWPIRDLRWVLVHGFTMDPARDFPRIKRLGCVVTALPPSALYRSGLRMVEEEPDEDRILALRDYTEAGLPWAMASDNKPYWLLFQLWAAVNRRERVQQRVIGPEQRIDVIAALRALTCGGAYVCHDEGARGSLEVGKLADLVVLSDDPLTVEPDALKDLRVEVTMVDGRIVYDTGVIDRDEGATHQRPPRAARG